MSTGEPRPRVLLVDDEPALLRAMARVLRDVCEVVPVESPRDALALGSPYGHQLVVTDYSMPGLDGVTFTRELRQRGFLGPVLLVTALAEQEDIIEAQASGLVTALLQKPWTPELLASKVRSLLGAVSSRDV